MKAYIQNVLNAPAKLPVMIRKGRKMVQLTKTTKSGQIKNIYKVNPDSHIIKQIKHKPVHVLQYI